MVPLDKGCPPPRVCNWWHFRARSLCATSAHSLPCVVSSRQTHSHFSCVSIAMNEALLWCRFCKVKVLFSWWFLKRSNVLLPSSFSFHASGSSRIAFLCWCLCYLWRFHCHHRFCFLFWGGMEMNNFQSVPHSSQSSKNVSHPEMFL